MEILYNKLQNTQVTYPSSKEIEQLNYIQKCGLTDVVNKALVELYRVQPPNPITFLASFLINEDKSLQILKDIENSKRTKQTIEVKIAEEEKVLKEEQDKINKKQDEEEDKKRKLKETITNCEDFEESFNDICEQFKNIIGATGVYIAKYDLKRKKVESVEEDENAHIDPDNIKVLRYIHWCNDHNFLHNQYLPPRKGVSYNLFLEGGGGGEEEDEEGDEGEKNEENIQENEQKNEENHGENEEEEEGEGKEKERKLKNIEINDCVSEKKMFYFKEPRLGSYLCYDISYNSSLNYSSLQSAITNLNEYLALKKEYDKRKAEREEEDKEKEGPGGGSSDRKNASGEAEEDENEGENDGEEREKDGEEEEHENESKLIKPELKEFDKEKKVLIIGMDTLGQDRTFSEGEKAFILEICELIRNTMEEVEKRKLERDRDTRIDMLTTEKPLVEDWNQDKFEQEEENAVRDYINSDDYLQKEIQDEEGRLVNENFAKTTYDITTITDGDFLSVLETFSKFEFVQFEKAFQNIFYFCKLEPNVINEDETNKLSWKKAKNEWEKTFEILKNYNPLGPKPDKLQKIFKGNIILGNLEPFLGEEMVEGVKEFSYVFYLLIKYIVDVLRVRRSDILYRHKTQRAAIKNRLEILKHNKTIDEERAKALKAARREFEGEPEEEEEKEEEGEEGEEGEKDEGENKEVKEEKGGDNDDEEEEEEEEEDGEEGEKEEEGKETGRSGKGKNKGKKKKKKEPKLDAEGNVIEFNEEEFLSLFDQEHPKEAVPEEVKIDEDGDFDVDEEGVNEEENEEKEEDEEGNEEAE